MRFVYNEGRPKTRSWEDKECNKKFATVIFVDNLIMLDKRSDGSHATTGMEGLEGMGNADIPPAEDGTERLPF